MARRQKVPFFSCVFVAVISLCFFLFLGRNFDVVRCYNDIFGEITTLNETRIPRIGANLTFYLPKAAATAAQSVHCSLVEVSRCLSACKHKKRAADILCLLESFCPRAKNADDRTQRPIEHDLLLRKQALSLSLSRELPDSPEEKERERKRAIELILTRASVSPSLEYTIRGAEQSWEFSSRQGHIEKSTSLLVSESR